MREPRKGTDLVFGCDGGNTVLSQITENRKVETHKPLIFRHGIFSFGLKNATLRQNPRNSVPHRVSTRYVQTSPRHVRDSIASANIGRNVSASPSGLGHVRQGMRCSRRHSVLGHTLLCWPGTSCVRWHAALGIQRALGALAVRPRKHLGGRRTERRSVGINPWHRGL